MVKQGGGVTKHAGVEVYVDLIVESLEVIENDFPQTVKLFNDFAKHRQGPSNFGFAELHKDDRLSLSLSKSKAGVDFYNKLCKQSPLVTVSNSILGDIDNIENVHIFSLARLENDPLGTLNEIFKAAYSNIRPSALERHTFLDGIERLNKILNIKPGAFGFSVDISYVISEWIKKKRNNQHSL